jgi:hypothetical protein
LILQPEAQYGQTVTTFFIALAPVKKDRALRLIDPLCIFYAMLLLWVLPDFTSEFWSKY